MAISKETFLVNQSNRTRILSEDEIKFVDKIEKYIDEEIAKNYDTFNTAISLDLCIANFLYDPLIKKSTSFSDTSRSRMMKELENRFTKVRWKIEVKIDNYCGMNSQDQWILKT